MSEEIEKRAYSRGYAAGRKRVETEEQAEQRRKEWLAESAARRRFRQDAFLAALQGTIAKGGWGTGDEPWKNTRDYVRGCWNFADEACRQNKEDFA